jgi:hypothetical protein
LSRRYPFRGKSGRREGTSFDKVKRKGGVVRGVFQNPPPKYATSENKNKIGIFPFTQMPVHVLIHQPNNAH